MVVVVIVDVDKSSASPRLLRSFAEFIIAIELCQ